VDTGSSHSDVSNNDTIEKYCYDNNIDSCAIYGGLYDWYEMMDYVTSPGAQGICPAGWHIPTDAEWTILTDFLGGLSVAGGKMKETGTSHWSSTNTDASNSSGFTALGAGYRGNGGTFDALASTARFWSSSEWSLIDAIRRILAYDKANVYSSYPFFKTNGFSVRCLRTN
jgi:uncharacterized protein (TIGR02145 family)